MATEIYLLIEDVVAVVNSLSESDEKGQIWRIQKELVLICVKLTFSPLQFAQDDERRDIFSCFLML